MVALVLTTAICICASLFLVFLENQFLGIAQVSVPVVQHDE